MWFQAPWYVRIRCRFLASEYQPFQCGTIQGFLGLFHERMRHFTSFPYMIHPYSDFITYWNFFLGFILAANIIYSPYLIAFNVNMFVRQPILSINLAITTFLLFDVLLNFVTGVRDQYSGKIVFDPRIIVWRYLKGWFLFDLVSRVPIDAILTLRLTEDQKNVKTNLEVIRIVALITRTFRYRKVYEILSRISEILAFRSIVYPWLLKLVILVLYCIHWMACFHWLLPDIVNARYPTPKPKSWVTAYNLWHKSNFQKYINAYLRSLSNLLTLDGGNFIPREVEEIMCTIIGIFLNLSLFGYFISSFTTIMGQLNASTEKFEHTFEMIHDYLTFKKIPMVLQEKVVTYFERKHRGHMFSDGTISLNILLSDLCSYQALENVNVITVNQNLVLIYLFAAAIMSTLSPSLRTELACHNCRTLIEKVPIFQKIPAGIVVNLAQKLEYDVYVPGDVLVTAETQGDAMFFIQNGEVHVLDIFGTKITSLRDGEFFGEMSLITNERTRQSVVAKVPCEIYKLSKANFRETVETSPEVFDRIAEVARDKLDAERRLAEEESRRADELRNWKNAKKQIEESIKRTNEIVIDESGIELIGGEEDPENQDEQTLIASIPTDSPEEVVIIAQEPTQFSAVPQSVGLNERIIQITDPTIVGAGEPTTATAEEPEEQVLNQELEIGEEISSSSSSSDDSTSGSTESESGSSEDDDDDTNTSRARN